MNKFVCFVFLLLFVFNTKTIYPQNIDYLKSNELRKESINKYLSKDYSGFLQKTLDAIQLRKNHPALIYNTAIGYALTNNIDSAISYLNQLAYMKLYFPAEKDSDFVSLWENQNFKNIVTKFESALSQYGKSEIAFSLNEKDLLTESVAYNPVTKNFYVGSVHKRKIICISNDGKAELFAESGENTFGGVFGMKIDSKNNLLWACTGYLPQMSGFNESQNGISEIIKFDLNSGKILQKYSIDEGEHLFGDLVIDSNGNFYISDSRDNNIYCIKYGDDKITLFLSSNNFASLQGIDFSADEDFLFAADYAMGLYKIEIKNKNVSSINIPKDLSVLGIDGLYFYKNSLIGIQNGVNPQRVIKMNLDNNLENITSWELLEANNEYFFEPTLGVLNGDYFYYIANSQWPNFNEDGTIASEEKLQFPVVLKLNLR